MFIKNSLLPVKGKTRLSIGFCLVLFLSLTSFTFPVGNSGSHLSLRFNNVPVFSSSGTAVFYENGTGTVLDVNANDGDGGADDVSVTYSISGEDADAFSIDTDGNLTFKVVPDHDTPSDADQDNFYHLTVTADDGELTDNTASQQVTVILIPEVEEGYNLSNEVQLGNSIFGEADGDESGESIAINGDGSIIAIGSIENTGSGAGAGHVRVFSFQDGTWTQMGSDLDAEAAGDKFGSAVSLSYDGTMLAVGATDNDDAAVVAGHTRVFKWTGSDWSQLGADIDGKLTGDWSGKYLSFSADGNTLAIGSQFPDDGATQVRVYTWDNTTWTQLGSDIGLDAGALQLNASGTTLVVGSSGLNGIGAARVYDWTGTAWVQRGADIDGEETGDEFGTAVGISADGNFLAIGAPGSDFSKDNTGSITFYYWNTDRWSQTRSTIQTSSENSRWGANLSLSADGSAVLWGTPSLSGSSGGARYAWWNGTAWEQRSIFSLESSSGQVVGLSADGRVAAVATPFADDITDDDNRGSVSAFLLINRTPVIRSTDQVSFPENSVDPVIDIDVVDGEGGEEDENLTYSLEAGGDNDLFSITQTGIITFNIPPDFEKPGDFNFDNVYELLLKIEDHPVELTQEIKVTVTDVSVDPPLFSSPGVIAFPENSTEMVVDVNANDGDGGADDESVTYSLSGEDATKFSINEEGILSFLTAPDFDDPADSDEDNFYRLTVTADDGGASNNLTTQELTVLIVPLIEEGYNRRTQLGSSIFGEADGDQFGSAVAMNATGTVMAVGSVRNKGAGVDAGHVRIYGLTNEDWVQLGSDLDAEAAGDKFGSSVSLSSDGTVLAIGAANNDGGGADAGHVKIYDWTNNEWVQRGLDIEGSGANDTAGSLVSLSADGNTVAIGAATGDDGTRQARIYRWNGTAWVQLGQDITGEISSLQLNALGNTLVTGIPDLGTNGTVRVYEWAEYAWLQRGVDLEGDEEADAFGTAVGISADGNTLAIGIPGHDSYLYDNVGGVVFYSWNVDRWSKTYALFEGSTENGRMGSDLGLSADGTGIISGNPAFGNFKGEVRYAYWNEGQWDGSSQQGPGNSNGSGHFGDFVSLSADGRVMMVGAPLANDIAEDDERGRVSTFSLVNRTPVILSVSEVTYEENRTDAVLDVNVSDGEGNPVDENITYSLGDGGDNIHFSINETGIITFNVPPNFEEPADFNFDNVYLLDVNIADYPINLTQQVIVTVTDASADPPIFSSPGAVTFLENSTDVVVDVNANDGQGGADDESVTYTLSGDDSGLFSITAEGHLTFNASPDYDMAGDADGNKFYELTVTADNGDPAGNTQDQELTVILIPVIEEGIQETATRIGEDINGVDQGDQLGSALGLSADGTVMAVGSSHHDGEALRTGQVQVYDWNGDTWTEKGDAIQGSLLDDRLGFSTSLSYDGNVVAVGAIYTGVAGRDAGYVQVFSWEDDGWTQVGVNIEGEAIDDRFGYSVSLNAKGNILAVSALGYGDDVGKVYIYAWDGTAWVQRGQAFEGKANAQIGGTVKLSATGNIVTFSSSGSAVDGTVTVYEWNGLDEWTALGEDPLLDENLQGLSVSSISADGHSLSAFRSDKARIYDWNGTDWIQRGEEISFGGGTPILNGDATGLGFHKLLFFTYYEWTGTEWDRRLIEYNEPAGERAVGSDIQFSLEGRVVAVGDLHKEVDGVLVGQVRVFSLLDRTPIFTSEPTAEFAENATGLVLDVDAFDGDDGAADEGLTYSFVEEGEFELFFLSETGEITFINPPDYEAPLDADKDNVYELTVRAADATNSITQSIRITVTDVDVDPPLFSSKSHVTFFENGTGPVLDVNANDGNGGDDDQDITYTISGEDAGLFSIDASGSLTFMDVPDFDAPSDSDGDNVYYLKVTAKDQAVTNNTTTQDLKLMVLPVLEFGLTTGTQLGEAIVGEDAGDFSGNVIELSADGKVMAIGATFNQAQGVRTGHVRVYNWNGTSWEQMGEDLDGEASEDRFGSAISLNYDGTAMAVTAPYNSSTNFEAGEVKVFDWNGQSWVQRGASIEGEEQFDQIGTAVDLNADATMLVVAAREKNLSLNDEGVSAPDGGQVRVYQWDGTAWLQMGSNINGKEEDERLGTAVTFDALGLTLAIGTLKNHLELRQWNGYDWGLVHDFIPEDNKTGNFGASMSLSGDGQHIAIGAAPSGFFDFLHGYVEVYSHNGSGWTQRGKTLLEGLPERSYFGRSLNMSADGNVLLVASSLFNDDRGKVWAFGWDETEWVEKFSVDGLSPDESEGSAIALSADGLVMATGAPVRGGAGFRDRAGHVRAFALASLDPTDVALSQNEINENQPVGTEVGKLSGINGAFGGNYTYSLIEGEGDDDNAAFEVDGNSLKTSESFDFEIKNTYAIRVRLQAEGDLSLEKAFVISVLNVNEVPSAFDLTSLVMAENQPSGTKVGDFNITDPDAGEVHTVTFSDGVGGEDNESFEISGNGLAIALVPDFETKSSYNVRLRATDQGGLFIERALVLTITDVNEAPTALNTDTEVIPENNVAGATVVNLSTIDQDNGDQHVYSLVAGQGADDNDAFDIDGSGLVAKNTLDFEIQNEYKVRLKTEDSGGLSFEQSFVFSISDEPDPILRLSESPAIPETGKGESSDFEITIFNDGEADLRVQQIVYPEAFSGPSGDITVAPSASQVITVTFSPPEAQVYAGGIEFVTNAGTQAVQVSGEGAIVAGIDDGLFSGNVVMVYPNPADHILTIDMSELTNILPLEIDIVNAQGIKKLTVSDYREKLLKVDVSSYQNGLYFIRFTDGKSSAVKKVMIRR